MTVAQMPSRPVYARRRSARPARPSGATPTPRTHILRPRRAQQLDGSEMRDSLSNVKIELRQNRHLLSQKGIQQLLSEIDALERRGRERAFGMRRMSRAVLPNNDSVAPACWNRQFLSSRASSNKLTSGMGKG